MSLLLFAAGGRIVAPADPVYVGGFDGPAELPRAAAVLPLLTFNPDSFFGAYTPRVEHTPADATELNTLLTGGTLNGETLQRGDWITLTAGTVYTSTTRRTQTFPALSGTFDWDDPSTWVWVRSTALGSLSAHGTRVASSDATALTNIANCARFDSFQNGGGVYPLIVANGASGYCLTGIGGRTLEGNWTAGNGYMAAFGIKTTQSALSDLPDGIVVDRCIFLGDPRNWTTNAPATPIGFWLNTQRFICRDSWVDAGASRGTLGGEGGGTENQAITASHWSGPGLIENNALIAAGENIITGGTDPEVGELRTNGINPTDVIFRRNYCPSRPEWNINAAESDGYGVVCKNNFELKKGVRWLIEDNDFSYWFFPDQGKVINIKRANQNGNDLKSRCEDITVRYNVAYDVPAFINFSNEGTADASIDRISVSHNLVPMRHVEELGALSAGSKPFTISSAANFKITHNTMPLAEVGAFAPSNAMEWTVGTLGYGDVEFLNNIGTDTGIAWRVNDAVTGNVNGWSGIRSRLASVVDGGNVLIGGGTEWDPAASAKPATVGDTFVDAAGNDFTVAATYATSGVGGATPGADIAAVTARTAGCRTGGWT